MTTIKPAITRELSNAYAYQYLSEIDARLHKLQELAGQSHTFVGGRICELLVDPRVEVYVTGSPGDAKIWVSLPGKPKTLVIDASMATKAEVLIHARVILLQMRTIVRQGRQQADDAVRNFDRVLPELEQLASAPIATEESRP